MSKIPLAIWLTDLHLTSNTIDTVFEIIVQVVNLCRQNSINCIFLGGDIFTSRVGQPQSVLSAFAGILDYIQENDIVVVCIPGNHDKTDYTSVESFLDAYDGRNGFTLYKQYGCINVAEHNLRFHFVPYFDEKLKYKQYLDQAISNVTLDVKNILFTHIAISGVKNNDGSEVSNEFNSSSFSAFFKVLVGHYHNRQLFDNIVYTGSCYQGNFGEDEYKGCTVIYDDGSIEFLGLSFPKYTTLYLDKEALSEMNENDITDVDGNVRLKLNFKPDAIESKKLQLLQAAGMKLEYEYEVSTSIDNEVKSKFDHSDIISYFNQWCEAEGIQDKEVGLKQLQV